MDLKIHEADFGRFIFLDSHTVVAEAKPNVNIDPEKVGYAIDLFEKEFQGDYAIILDRKADYSIMPVQVFQFFSNIDRLRALAIVRYKTRDSLPEDMEKRIFKRDIEKFSSIEDAHQWIVSIFQK